MTQCFWPCTVGNWHLSSPLCWWNLILYQTWSKQRIHFNHQKTMVFWMHSLWIVWYSLSLILFWKMDARQELERWFWSQKMEQVFFHVKKNAMLDLYIYIYLIHPRRFTWNWVMSPVYFLCLKAIAISNSTSPSHLWDVDVDGLGSNWQTCMKKWMVGTYKLHNITPSLPESLTVGLMKIGLKAPKWKDHLPPNHPFSVL